ncbi:hypothetical protein E4U21_002881 [Claviceps maximensis]|nr:hypothetical protein E4U21_002881 [Claviceps maximensis]
MYVPIPADFLTRFTPPTTSEEHLQASISTLNAHASAVKANIMALTKRECVRIVREVDATGERGRQPLVERMGLRPEDRTAMVKNLEAPKGAAGGEVRELAELPNFEAWPSRRLEEWEEVRLMGVVSRTMMEIAGYERHVGLVRGGYEEMLRRERGGERMEVDAMGDGGGIVGRDVVVGDGAGEAEKVKEPACAG